MIFIANASCEKSTPESLTPSNLTPNHVNVLIERGLTADTMGTVRCGAAQPKSAAAGPGDNRSLEVACQLVMSSSHRAPRHALLPGRGCAEYIPMPIRNSRRRDLRCAAPSHRSANLQLSLAEPSECAPRPRPAPAAPARAGCRAPGGGARGRAAAARARALRKWA